MLKPLLNRKRLAAEYDERKDLKLLTEDDIPAERIQAMLAVVGRTSGLMAALDTENEKRTADLAAVRSSSLKWRAL